ncbi:MAG: hypothetical protein AABY15_03040 [Nanoarchaeota archaeon]
MELKITGNTEERFNNNLKSFLNVATMICLKGNVPTQKDIDQAEALGRWWTLEEKNKRYQILGSVNDNWLNIRESGVNYIIVEFNFRYDIDSQKKKAISNLMLAFFDFVEKVD